MKKLFVTIWILLNGVLANATGPVSCNLDSIKEIGADTGTFNATGKASRIQYSSAFYCDQHQGDAALAVAKEQALKDCRASGYSNCRITTTTPSPVQTLEDRLTVGVTSQPGYCYASAEATGEKTPQALSAATYSLLLCKRINECIIDHVGELSNQVGRKLIGLGCLNSCFSGASCSR